MPGPFDDIIAGLKRILQKNEEQAKQEQRDAQKEHLRGHGGIATRNRNDPDLSAENQAKWKSLHGLVVYGFIYEREILTVHSSNVMAAQYDRPKKELIIKFKKKGRRQTKNPFYIYMNVTTDEAVSFAKEMSKGGWVWDHLRILGTRYGHKKPYATRTGFRRNT